MTTKTTKRLKILQESLKKKEQKFDEKLKEHFADVFSANGQPLNDKSNGRSTLSRWDRQNNSLHVSNESIEKTKNAIEKETDKIANISLTNKLLPDTIIALIDSGELVQWRKYPHIFFVNGIKKARMIWNVKKQNLAHKYVDSLNQEDRRRFAKIYNKLFNDLNLNKNG